MKRLASLGICVMVVLSLFAGCDSENSSNDKRDTSMFIEEVENVRETVTIGVPPSGNLLREDVIEEIERLTGRSVNIELNFTELHGSTAREVLEKDHYGEFKSLDAMVVEGDILPLIAQDYALDLTELFQKHAPNYYNQLFPEDLARVTYDGKIMAIPNHMRGSKRICAVVREDLLSELGIDSIKDFDEYEIFMEKVKKRHPDFFSVTAARAQEIFLQSMGLVPFMNGIVYKWDDPEMKLMPIERTEEFKTALARQNSWAVSGYIPRRYSNRDNPHEYIVDSKGLVKAALTDNLASFTAEWDSALVYTRILNTGEFSYKIFPLEINKAAPEADMFGTVIVVNKNSGNAERILKLIEWIHASQENYDLVMYGLKGRDYILEGNQVKLLNGPYGVFYNWSGSEAFRNINFERAFVTDQLSNPAAYEPGKDPGLRTLPTEGFTLIPNGIISGFEKRDRNFLIGDTYERESLLDMALVRTSTVVVNPEEAISIDVAIEQIRYCQQLVRNIDRVVEELQKQLDAWRQSK